MVIKRRSSKHNGLPTLSWGKCLIILAVSVFMIMGVSEGVVQRSESRFIHSVAREVVDKARATDAQSRVIALRDYIRANISFGSAPYGDRPFLRSSAAETLRSGKGFCGEVTRTFICMADALGIRAQRINLWGAEPHVVAEVELAPGERVLVDCQNPPKIVDMEQLDETILKHGYSDYYTLNLRRLGINWLVTRVKIEMGPLIYWTENPHALKSLLYFLFALALPSALLIARSLRALARVLLRRRGWVHMSNTRAIQEAARAVTTE